VKMNADLFLVVVVAFLASVATAFHVGPTSSIHHGCTRLFQTATTEATAKAVDPKAAVKLFGRLAEKYIMLDASAGMCCYSGCKDCEFRDPNGGYRMADQSSSRPKWIPTYEYRNFASSGKEHATKWSTEIFTEEKKVVTKQEFVEALGSMPFVPPLASGAPYLSASAAKKIDDIEIVESLFDVLVQEKDVLTEKGMSRRMKEISEGEEGLTWPLFSKALGL